MLDLCAQVKNNQFALCDEVINSEVGSAVYLNAAMLNHSCRPNAFPIFEGRVLQIKALRQIKEDEGMKLVILDRCSYIFRNLHLIF